ncbi:hypothetical protein Tco_0173223 [Tanacetum coccineum]
MGDENPIRTLGDDSKPSHEGYKNTIELSVGNNVVPLRSDTIRLVQNECSFHGLRSEDPSQHLKDFLKIVDSLDLDGENKERTRLRRTAKLCNDVLIAKLRDRNAKESWALLEDLALYDNESWNDPRDFAKPVKAIAQPQDVPSTSDRRLIELENQVQRLMEAHLALTQPTQVNQITTSYEICSGPHDTQYCMEDPEQAIVEYTSSRTDEVGVSPQFCMLVLTQLKTRNAQPQNDKSKNEKSEERDQGREGNPEDNNTVTHNEEQRDTPQLELELRDATVVDNFGPNLNDNEIEWLDVKEPLDLVNTSEESIYVSLIKEMPKC